MTGVRPHRAKGQSQSPNSISEVPMFLFLTPKCAAYHLNGSVTLKMTTMVSLTDFPIGRLWWRAWHLPACAIERSSGSHAPSLRPPDPVQLPCVLLLMPELPSLVYILGGKCSTFPSVPHKSAGIPTRHL